MQLAATRGFQTANRRGLGNSSMAGQAAQLAVFDAATPIATADASDRLTRDMTGDELANRIATTGMNNAASLAAAQMSADASKYSTDKQAEVSFKLAEINNRHDLTLQEKDQLAKVALAQLGFAHESVLADKDIAGRTTIAQMGIDANAAEGVLNRAFQADQQSQQLAAQYDLAGLDQASRERIVTKQLEAEAAQRELDRAVQLNLGTAEIQFRQDELAAKLAAAQQERIASIVSDTNATRMQAYANTLSDPKMPAAARTAVQQSIDAQYQQTVNYISNLYGVGLNATTPTPVMPASSTPVIRPPA